MRRIIGKRTSRQTAVSLAAIAALTGAGIAQAALENIVVSVRKIEESAQEVPVSVSAFTQDTITELNLKSIDDIAKFTPGFSFTSAFGRQPGSDRPSIRGVTTILNGIANSSAVGYFVDGVYLSGAPQSTELYNLERVEVIKGPQSAQFGRGTYAGAINYVTRKPSTETTEGGVTATGAQHEAYELNGWVSGPIVRNLSYYVGGGFDTYGGEFTNQATGEKLGGTETQSFTGKLLWTPSEQLSFALKGGYQQTRDDHFAIYLQPRTDNNCYFRSPDAPRAREYYCGDAIIDKDGIDLATQLLSSAEDGLAGAQLDRYLGSLTIDYDFANGWVFTSNTGYIKDNLDTGYDVSYANYDPIPFGASAGSFNRLSTTETETFSQEFRLSTDRDKRLRATGGVYFLDIEGREVAQRKVGFDGVTGRNVVSNLTTDNIQNWAVFAGVDWDITDATTVTLEARYAEDDIEVASIVNDGSGAVDPCGPNPSCKETFDSFTPRFTIRHMLTDDANIYANIAKGTKPGDFNATVPVDPVSGDPDESFRAVDEESMISYEIGAKTAWLDQRLIANAAVYFNDITDQQLTQNIEGPGGTPQSVLANVGKTEVWGFELDTSFLITDNWTGGFIYSYIDSKIKERFSSDQADLLGGNGTLEAINTLGDVSGKESPRVPKHQFAVRTRYDIPMSWGGMYLGANFTYEASKYSQEHNLIETGDRQLLGAQIGATFGNWDLQIWGKNLTDDDTPLDILRYIDRRFGTLTGCTALPPTDPDTICAGSSTSPRGFANTLQAGRQVGATLSYRFGGDQ